MVDAADPLAGAPPAPGGSADAIGIADERHPIAVVQLRLQVLVQVVPVVDEPDDQLPAEPRSEALHPE